MRFKDPFFHLKELFKIYHIIHIVHLNIFYFLLMLWCAFKLITKYVLSTENHVTLPRPGQPDYIEVGFAIDFLYIECGRLVRWSASKVISKTTNTMLIYPTHICTTHLVKCNVYNLLPGLGGHRITLCSISLIIYQHNIGVK